MSRAIQRIGVLTSGGDCAGLNAAIRAVVRRAIQGYGWEVTGIRDGTAGLTHRPLRHQPLDLGIFTGELLRRGGTMLGTVNKGNPFAYPMPDGSSQDLSGRFVEGFRELGLDALIGIGGDGSMEILGRLARQGDVAFVGIPKTIDNDVPHTEFAIGFATAVTAVVEALDRLQPTAASHNRVMILEVMGRHTGHLALDSGIAGGADVILIPEIPFDLGKVAETIRSVRDQGRNHALVVCAEAARRVGGEPVYEEDVEGRRHYGGVGHWIGHEIERLTDAETRVTVLGHVQRGGTPVAMDRILASAFGVHAVDLLASGESGRMVAWQNRAVVDVSIDDVIGRSRAVDPEGDRVRAARGLGISLGN